MTNESKKEILLVEDDDNDAELMMVTLTEHNIANHIQRVNDGVEAIDYLYRRENYQDRTDNLPAVILLDLKLPRKGGLEVLQEVRSSDRLKHIPVVMLTSSREEQDLIRSYELGVNAYVVKPVSFEEFSVAIKEVGIFWLMVNTPPPLRS